MSDEYDGPCRTCGGKARRRQVRNEELITDSATSYRVERQCTNPQCPTNSGESSVKDQV